MPQMGYDMQEGTLIRWLKDEGSNVDLGEPVAEIETDKAVVEFESYASGVLREILVPEGSTVPVGEAIAVVGDAVSAAPSAAPDAEPEPAPEVVEETADVAETADGEGDAPASAPAAIPLGAASETASESAASEPEPAPEPEPAASPPAPARRVLATPIARQMAQDAGIDLADVDGSGPGGRIVREDVESAIAARQSAQDAAAEEPADAEESAQPEPESEPEIAAEAASAEDEDEGADEEESDGEPVAETEAAVEEEAADEESEPEAEVEIAVAASVEDGEPEAAADDDAEESEPEIAVEIAVAVSVEDDESESAGDEDAEREVSFEIAVAASDDDGQAEPAAVEIAVAASVEDDAEESAEAAIAEPEDADEADDGLLPLSRTRRQIARVTTRSKSEKPHFYVNVDVDMTDAMALRSQINAALAADGVRVTVNDMIIAASAIALKRFPKFNAYYEEGGVRMNAGVNVGVAMALEEGLIMPAIVGAGGMSLREIAQASKDLSERAQRGALSAPEYSGGTFAISNMGMMGVTGFTAIIQPPQTAVLAVGAVQKRAMVADDDQIAVRQMMTATLSADHRIVDGAEGAMFVNEIKSLLENPLSVIL